VAIAGDASIHVVAISANCAVDQTPLPSTQSRGNRVIGVHFTALLWPAGDSPAEAQGCMRPGAMGAWRLRTHKPRSARF